MGAKAKVPHICYAVICNRWTAKLNLSFICNELFKSKMAFEYKQFNFFA